MPIQKVTDPSILAQLNHEGNVVAANPLYPTQAAQGQATLTRTQQEIQQAQATAAANTERTKAEAQSAEIAAKTAQEAYDASHPKGTNATVLGPDSLKSLSMPDQELVKALAEGRLAFPGGFALKAPWWQQKLEQVAAYDPSFDATNYNNRAKARAILLSGKVGTSANALNTAIGHLGLLNSQIGGTASHNFTPLNAVVNKFEQLTGDPGITNFKDTAGKLASELTSVYRNGGGAEADVVRQLESVDPNASMAQKQGIVKNALELLASKQAANLYQYNIGSGGKPPVDLLDPSAQAVLKQFPDIRDKYFGASSSPLSPQATALLTHNGGTPPSAPPPAAPGSDGNPPNVNGGAPQQTIATGPTRNEYDSVVSAGLDALIRKGAPYREASAYAQSHGYAAPQPGVYADAIAYHKANPSYAGSFASATHPVPTTAMERFSASPLAAGIVGAGTGATAGLSDVAGRALLGPAWDANRTAISSANPGADLAGNVLGGVAGTLGGEAAIGKLAPALVDAARASRIAPYLPAASDAAYGATYGASENPSNPTAGALVGALTGAAGGAATRGTLKTVGRVIAPDAGALAPLYDQGVLPSIGQRAGAMTGPIGSRIGRAINLSEQAAQSVPLAGAIPALARQGARNDFQLGAFNDALGELGQSLPKGTAPGPDAHSFTSDVFNKAYDAARSGMQFVADEPFGQQYGDFAKSLQDGTLSADQAGNVQNAIKSSLDGRLDNGGMKGANYKAAVSDLQRKAATWAGNQNTAAQAPFLSQFANMLDDAARRNSDPQASALLDAADKGYAKFVRIQKASQVGGAQKDAGTFSPANYASAVKSMGGGLRTNAYSQGDALGQDYAQAGLNLSDTLPDSGTPLRMATLGALGTGAYFHPGAAGIFAPFALGKLGAKLVAPRSSDALNLVGNGLYDRANSIGRVGAPTILDLLLSQ